MEAGVATLLLAWGAPVVLLALITVRYVQVRRRRARARRSSAERVGSDNRYGVPVSGPATMRRRDRAISDPERINAIMGAATTCRIGLAVAQEPYVVPLSFGLADRVAQSMELESGGDRFVLREGSRFRLYFHAASQGRKLEMLRTNRRACIEIEGRVSHRQGDQPCEWTTLYESIIGYGELCEVTDPEEKRAGLTQIMLQHGAEGPFEFPDSAVERTTVIRMDLTELTGKSNLSEEETV